MSKRMKATNNRDTKDTEVSTDTRLDFGVLKAEVEQMCSKWEKLQTFSLAELAREVGDSEANLLYLEQKYQILTPFTEKKGTMDVRRYTIADLKNALFFSEAKNCWIYT